jgi:hypothetical protein
MWYFIGYMAGRAGGGGGGSAGANPALIGIGLGAGLASLYMAWGLVRYFLFGKPPPGWWPR